jgi:hypothetical protein
MFILGGRCATPISVRLHLIAHPVLTEYRRVGLGRIVRIVGSAPSFSNVIRSSVLDFLLSATRLTCARL